MMATDDFSNVTTIEAGPLEDTFGFSAIRPVPGSNGIFMAVKAKEIDDQVHSKLMVVDSKGNMLLDPKRPETGVENLPLLAAARAKRERILDAIKEKYGEKAVQEPSIFCREVLKRIHAGYSATASNRTLSGPVPGKWPPECMELEHHFTTDDHVPGLQEELVRTMTVPGAAAVVEGVGVREGFVEAGPFKFEGLSFVT